MEYLINEQNNKIKDFVVETNEEIISKLMANFLGLIKIQKHIRIYRNPNQIDI